MLLAIAIQPGPASSMSWLEPMAYLAAYPAIARTICHTADPVPPQRPDHAPAHMPDCLVCLLCTAVQVPPVIPSAGNAGPLPPLMLAAARAELPPPSRAPPPRVRPPSQPRAPPVLRLHA